MKDLEHPILTHWSVVKTNNIIRLCMDILKLNEIILPDYESVPPIEDILRTGKNK